MPQHECAHALCDTPVVGMAYGCPTHQSALPAEVRDRIVEARRVHGAGSYAHHQAMHAADVAWRDLHLRQPAPTPSPLPVDVSLPAPPGRLLVQVEPAHPQPRRRRRLFGGRRG